MDFFYLALSIKREKIIFCVHFPLLRFLLKLLNNIIFKRVWHSTFLQLGMTKRDGLYGPARGMLVKNAGRADLFNPLTRISPQPARASSGAGAGRGLRPLTRKKKKLVAAGQRTKKSTTKKPVQTQSKPVQTRTNSKQTRTNSKQIRTNSKQTQ